MQCEFQLHCVYQNWKDSCAWNLHALLLEAYHASRVTCSTLIPDMLARMFGQPCVRRVALKTSAAWHTVGRVAPKTLAACVLLIFFWIGSSS